MDEGKISDSSFAVHDSLEKLILVSYIIVINVTTVTVVESTFTLPSNTTLTLTVTTDDHEIQDSPTSA